MITASTLSLGDHVPNRAGPVAFLFWVVWASFSLSLAGALVNQVPAMTAHAAHTTRMAEGKTAVVP
jgi:hypothetical protein